MSVYSDDLARQRRINEAKRLAKAQGRKWEASTPTPLTHREWLEMACDIAKELGVGISPLTAHLNNMPDTTVPLGASTTSIDGFDPVHRPVHYASGDIECIDAIRTALGPEGFAAYCRGNVIKYLWRLGKKGAPAQDAEKAAWYANKHAEAMKAVTP